MTTIVNNPPSSDNSGGPVGWIVLLIILLVMGYKNLYMDFLRSDEYSWEVRKLMFPVRLT